MPVNRHVPKMDKIHNLLTRRVPREIASHIFAQCISSDLRRHQIQKEIICQPLVLGAVCQSWRDIAWTTPQLWTTIIISILPPPDPSLKLELLDQWIARSRYLPLNISFNSFPNHLLSPMETLYYPLIDLLNQHSSRWRSLYLFVSRTLLNRFSGDGGTISILNSLTLLAFTFPHFPIELHRFSLRTVSPRPQFVELLNVPLSSVDIKWNNLTKIKATFRINELLQIFHHAHQLVSCTVTKVLRSSHNGISYLRNSSSSPFPPAFGNTILFG